MCSCPAASGWDAKHVGGAHGSAWTLSEEDAAGLPRGRFHGSTAAAGHAPELKGRGRSWLREGVAT